MHSLSFVNIFLLLFNLTFFTYFGKLSEVNKEIHLFIRSFKIR